MGLRRKKGRHNMTHKIRRIATMRSLLWLTACVGPLTQWGEEISLAPEKARVRAHRLVGCAHAMHRAAVS